MPADAPKEPPQMTDDLPSRGRLARPQQTATVKRQKTASVVMGIEPRELPMPMHHFGRVIDIEVTASGGVLELAQ